MFSRIPPVVIASLLFAFNSCSQQARVDQEAKERTRMESYDEQIDSTGRFVFDETNAERAFTIHCSQCHQNPLPLYHLARTNPHQFWKTVNFGNDSLGMHPQVDKIPFQDLVDLTGYCMHSGQVGKTTP